MSHPAHIDSYIPVRDAAQKAHLHPDYIARLARQSKIASQRVGRRWFVDPHSLDAFLAQQSAGKEAWRQELKHTRRKEYEKSNTEKAGGSAVAAIEEALAEKVSPKTHHVVVKGLQHGSLLTTPGINMHAMSYAIHPGTDFIHKLIALLTAFILVFGSYGVFDREFGSAMARGVGDVAHVGASFAAVMVGADPDCDSTGERMAAAAHVSFENILISLDNLMPSGLSDRALAPSACPH